MSARLGALAVLILALAPLAVIPRPATGQEPAANASDQPQYRTWTNRQGVAIEAKFLGLDEGKVLLKKKDDGKIYPLAVESLSDADQKYVEKRSAGKEPSEKKRGDASHSVAEINLSGGKKSGSAALPEAKEVIVTGVGTDPEKAMQNAFSQAIEQTVGLLVDAETVVKNDQLIRDEVLTYSRGYMEKYDVVKRWQEDGLHHTTIRAVVARGKLTEKLKGMKIAVQEVSGELPARQFHFDAKNEEQAAEMFKKALADFDMMKLTKVEIVGKPEPKRENGGASVHVKVRLSPDQKRWNDLARDVRVILSKTSNKRASVVVAGGMGESAKIVFGKHLPGSGKGSAYEVGQRLRRQLEGDGVLIALLTNTSIDGSRMDWEIFRVPKALEGAIRTTLSPLHRVVYVLLDEHGDEITRVKEQIKAPYDRSHEEREFSALLRRQFRQHPLDEAWWIGPVWTYIGITITPVLVTETTISVSQQDLGRLARTAVFLEEDTKHERSSPGKRPGSDSRPHEIPNGKR